MAHCDGCDNFPRVQSTQKKIKINKKKEKNEINEKYEKYETIWKNWNKWNPYNYKENFSKLEFGVKSLYFFITKSSMITEIFQNYELWRKTCKKEHQMVS